MMSSAQPLESPLLKGFVYLKDVDSTIIQSMRYLSHHNFLGRPVAGYKRAEVIFTQQAAEALRMVQQELLGEGYSLVVYDTYRPQKAVNNFIAWSEDSQDQVMKAQYYPRAPKEKVFELGYISKRSGHTRGSTVDLTIISVDKVLKTKIEETPRVLNDGFEVLFLDDGTVDMGTSFDLFDVASHHDCDLISQEHLAQRNYLREKMKKHGFKEYQKEWWHYTLANEPYPDTYFDFDII